MAPQTRGIPDPADIDRITAALRLQAEVQHQLETAVADTLKAGGSVRETAAASGVSARTVQRYGKKHGWPTDEQRARWEADRAVRDEWTARMEAATAMLSYLGEDDATETTEETT